jgi:hypothetical protein
MIATVRIVCFAILAAMGSTTASADRLVQVPGTIVSVTMPEEFQQVEGLSGLVDPSTGASLIVTELPGPAYPEIKSLFSTVESLNAKFGPTGIKIASIEQLRTDSGDLVSLAHGVQDAVSGRSDKWMAVFSGAKTAVVTMQVPHDNPFDAEMVRAAFASVVLGEPLSESELLARLPFRLQIIEPFRFVGVPTGSAILLTAGPDDLNKGSKQPTVFVVRQVVEVKSEPLERMAETQLRSTSSFNGAIISGRSSIDFAEKAGILLEGIGQRDGVKFDFRQYFSIVDGKFIRLVAVAPVGMLQDLIPTVETIARSVEIK